MEEIDIIIYMKKKQAKRILKKYYEANKSTKS